MLDLSTILQKNKKFSGRFACYIKYNAYLCNVQVRNATSITITHNQNATSNN